MEAIERLLAWATARGVVLDGIGPRLLPGRGVGIVATRALKQGEPVLIVPTRLLRSLDSAPAPLARALARASAHAVVAAALCLETDPDFAAALGLEADPDFVAWRAVLPARADVAAGMPLFWPPALQALLPQPARDLVAKQRAKLDADWAAVAAACPAAPARDDFDYAWALVNSRSFYHVTPRTRARPRADHIVLQPVADLFNHDARGCSVAFARDACTVTTARAHAPGDELFLRYGTHANDVLLVEYGFALPAVANPWDETCLDAYLCPLFSAAQREALDEAGFWRGYMLDAHTACYRTHTALRLLCLGPRRWREVLDGTRDEDADAAAVARELLRLLHRCAEGMRAAAAAVEAAVAPPAAEPAREALRARWAQVVDLVAAATARLEA